MEAFVSRKRRRLSTTEDIILNKAEKKLALEPPSSEEDSTELKLALLSSLNPQADEALLLETLLAHEGSVERASEALSSKNNNRTSKKTPISGSLTYQSSLASITNVKDTENNNYKRLTKKGRTLHLYSPEDVAQHTPCSIIHNFLPPEEANNLLRELLVEASTFQRQTFRLFENVVSSPHTASFYVQSMEEERKQKTEYVYNGSYMTDVRQITPYMRQVATKVQRAVNEEITHRIQTHYPEGQKLRYQSPKEWIPNAAFVNCYKGGSECVGYHSDQLTYLGPRAVIGSLSLGVTREFRVRKVIPRETVDGGDAVSGDHAQTSVDDHHHPRADLEGQIAIHLPHNSLLVMHAEMQEEWKHSIAPAQAIDPHPIAGNKRINITYRCYRESFHPSLTPRCHCDVATVLRCVQRKKENWGRYFWMCYAGTTPGKEGCTFFQWAEFDDDGEPMHIQARKKEEQNSSSA
ncbi:MAG: hypothetical protein M1823_004822 [Watsoniomyces obsoletus]|nr:MAG: hypothetical protein M1823_004822 [Watsoniomyces obsoletus]